MIATCWSKEKKAWAKLFEIRIYAPWDVVTNKQAAKTQQWQATCFLQIDINGNTDLARAAKFICNEIK